MVSERVFDACWRVGVLETRMWGEGGRVGGSCRRRAGGKCCHASTCIVPQSQPKKNPFLEIHTSILALYCRRGQITRPTCPNHSISQARKKPSRNFCPNMMYEPTNASCALTISNRSRPTQLTLCSLDLSLRLRRRPLVRRPPLRRHGVHPRIPPRLWQKSRLRDEQLYQIEKGLLQKTGRNGHPRHSRRSVWI